MAAGGLVGSLLSIAVAAGCVAVAIEEGHILGFVVLGALALLFGVLGVVGVFVGIQGIRGAGMVIDDHGITVQVANHRISFAWAEVARVDFFVHVRAHSQQSKQSHAPMRKRRYRMKIRLAPVFPGFDPRPRLDRLEVADLQIGPHTSRDNPPYTHAVRVPPTGPYASSMERINAIDAALRAHAGVKYAGMDNNLED